MSGFCDSCEQLAEGDWEYCPHCGGNIVELELQECPHCHADVSQEHPDDDCPECGEALS